MNKLGQGMVAATFMGTIVGVAMLMRGKKVALPKKCCIIKAVGKAIKSMGD